jgi:hypothetical protein
VEILWMDREFPVDGWTTKIFSADAPLCARGAPIVCAWFRTTLRLFVAARRVQFIAFLTNTLSGETVAEHVHRYQESIAGRSYVIEVSPVASDRWRAYIVKIPGVPTALMPFYGATPDEAARQLCNWLTRAHHPTAVAVPRV